MPLSTQIVQNRISDGGPAYASSPAAPRAQSQQVRQVRQRPVLRPFTPAQLANTALGAQAVHGLDVRLVTAITRAPAALQGLVPRAPRQGTIAPSVNAPGGRPTFSLVQGSMTTDGARTGMIDPDPAPTIPNDAATVLHAQIMLANWRSAYGSACVPADFGATPADFNGVTVGGSKDRTAKALTSFAVWSNTSFPTVTPLNPDGQLDTVIYERLNAVNDAINAQRANLKVQAPASASPGAASSPARPWLVPAVAAAAVAAYVFRRDLARLVGSR